MYLSAHNALGALQVACRDNDPLSGTLQSLFASENTKVLGDKVPGSRLTGWRAHGSILASPPQGLYHL